MKQYGWIIGAYILWGVVVIAIYVARPEIGKLPAFLYWATNPVLAVITGLIVLIQGDSGWVVERTPTTPADDGEAT